MRHAANTARIRLQRGIAHENRNRLRPKWQQPLPLLQLMALGPRLPIPRVHLQLAFGHCGRSAPLGDNSQGTTSKLYDPISSVESDNNCFARLFRKRRKSGTQAVKQIATQELSPACQWQYNHHLATEWWPLGEPGSAHRVLKRLEHASSGSKNANLCVT